KHGLEWIQPPAALAHPLDDGTAAVLERSIERTCATLGTDAPSYAKCFSPLVRDAEKLIPEILAPPLHLPRYPLPWLRFGVQAVQSARRFVRRRFHGPHAAALFTGIAGHANMPLDAPPTAAFGLLLGILGHWGGWP